MKERGVFLDRDGVINEIVYFPELGILDSPLIPAQFKLLPRVSEAIKKLNALGLKVIITSNQPAIAKGKSSEQHFKKIREKMIKTLQEGGAKIDGEYYCFHHPEAKLEQYRINCDCRKPKPGLLLQAAKDFSLDLKECYLIGDGINDIQAGKAVGCTTFLIGNMKCDLCRHMEKLGVKPDYIVADLYEAVKIIER
jgi:D-glycero-D-manno-heptose 1,7-bisphosphate phosphatase